MTRVGHFKKCRVGLFNQFNKVSLKKVRWVQLKKRKLEKVKKSIAVQSKHINMEQFK